MKKLQIVQYKKDYHKILTSMSKKVDKIDDIHGLVDDMKYTCITANGLGLAAPQVGRNLRIIVLSGKSFGKDGMVCVVNPELEILDATMVENDEFCLSFPRIAKKVSRPKEVRVFGYDELGNEVSYVGKDISARLICHEINHLDGITLAQL